VRDKAPPLIADANVLIDYVNTDASILALLARHDGPVFVATAVLENVDQLDVAECERLGLTVVQPTVEELMEAGAKRGGLAFDDHVCLILAREHKWCCVTNDKALRKACSVEKVRLRWGLEVMLTLVEKSVLAAEDAVAVARAIRATNPFISEAIVEQFEHKAREAGQRVPRKGGR
jgi:predicted nucleic acid-binding protein